MLEVRSILSGAGVTGGGVNLLYFDGSTGSDAEAAAFAVNEFWQAIKGALTNAVSIDIDTQVNHVDIATGEILDSVGPVTSYDTTQGTDGTHTLPLSTQGMIHFRTGLYTAGRELRGRIFVPCFGEDMNENGAPNGAATTALQAAGDALLAQTAVPLVWSRTHGVAQAISAAQASNKWAVLRSRRD